MSRLACVGIVLTVLPLSAGIDRACAQTTEQRKGLTAPPNTLLQGAYRAMVTSLKAESRKALDRDYVDGQIEYQKGNAALFQYEIQYGTDADLKEFARATLPKIEDHLQRALRLAGASKSASNYRLAPANRRFAYRIVN